ncbi:MAG: indoleacetamide hydrolase [Alphaproteobacteria bacterium]|nr:indoleacetamide hydrolase [Alphaproteobacteria bacterium]
MDVTQYGAVECQAAMARRELTALALAEALLARAAIHADLNAFTHLDPEGTRRAAAAADDARAAGAAMGVLQGLPFAVKDNIDTAEMPTTGGTPTLLGHRPRRDAGVVERLRAAGAVLLGKTNLHELAYGVTSNNATFGAVRNPYDRRRIAGGSSGGSAAALAARLCPAALGTDTGGSVRVPAALCGVAGLRPSPDRYPQDGIILVSHTRDVAGPMARTVADVALLDGVLSGAVGPLPVVALRGLRLGVPRQPFRENLDPAVAAALAEAERALAAAGAVLVEGEIEEVGALCAAAGFPIALYETVPNMARYLRDAGRSEDFAALAAAMASPDVHRILTGLAHAGVPDAAYRQAMDTQRPALRASYRRYFARHGVACAVFPTTVLPAAPIGEDAEVTLNGARVPTFQTYIRNSDPSSVAGLPGISVPMGTTPDGLPLGLELDGPEGSDRRLLAIAMAVAAVLPATPPPSGAGGL